MRDAVRPLDEGDGGQLIEPDVHRPAIEVFHRGVVGEGLAHLVDELVVLGVAPAPGIVGGRAGGLDEAAVVLAQCEIGVAHRAEIAAQVGARGALAQAAVKIGGHAEGGVDTGLFELGDEHRGQVLEVREDVDDHAQRLAVLFPEFAAAQIALAPQDLGALFQVEDADPVLFDEVFGEGEVFAHLR